MSEKTIIRVAERKRWLHMAVTPLEDDRISFKAKGILAYLLGKPDDWTVRMQDLVNRSTDGRDAVRSGIVELIKFGYIVRTKTRGNDGTFGGYEYVVYECSQIQPQNDEPEPEPQEEQPETENPYTDKPFTENPLYTNNHSTNDSILDTNVSRERDEKPPKQQPVENSSLSPESESAKLMFRKLQDNAKAMGRRGPRRFKTLECKREFEEAAHVLGPVEFERVLTAGLRREINSVSRLTAYIAGAARKQQPQVIKVRGR